MNMNKPQTIAGVVLTLNEEHDLRRSLQSLAWCDELVVVDSGSIDRTHDIAIQCGAKFLQHIQSPPFLITDQRNWVLDCAGLKSDWVLFIDADEEVLSPLANTILQCINSDSAYDSYELTPRYWFLGKWLKRTQSFPNWHPRLLRRGSVRFQGGVWESFSDNALTDRIYLPYEHYAFSKGLDDWIARHLRYASWEAEKIDSYLQTRKTSSLGTARSLFLRVVSARLIFLRPLMRFLQKYILHLGFLEGWQALIYSLMIAFYDLMTILKIIEIRRHRSGLSL